MTPPLTDRLPILTEVIDPGAGATADVVQAERQSGLPAQGAAPTAGAGPGVSPSVSRMPAADHGARPIPTGLADHLQTRRLAVQADLLKRIQDEVAERLGRNLEGHFQALLQRHAETWARELASELQPVLRDEIQGVMTEILTQGSNPAP
ncbi:hypothetical protein GALL_151940 [mine drainage metagenome]|uniref:Uncharacterized protein n=1 Tax=mine drainage metagenome TaxID=410659 RepID=A0A1J5SEW2_9ZZZZ